jgi:hypothetical protein
MGSMARKMRRQAEKAQYKKFQKAWNREQQFQAHLEEQGKELNGPKLKRKPTFTMWKNIVKEAEARKKVTPEEVQEHIDTSWDEDETKEEKGGAQGE